MAGVRNRSRTVGYSFSGAFDESSAERTLAKARAAGVVTEFDTGRGSLVWFNGHPGAALRRVRADVAQLVGEKA